MARCHIALGGNAGDVERAFDEALSRLAATRGVQVVCVSAIYQTRAVGDHAGGSFRNAAAEIDASLEPLALLDLLQDIERRAGRVSGPHWGPRPLDLDLIFYANRVMESDRLSVPHPACWYRRFVLDPLSTIAGDVLHPVKGATVAELRARLLPRPLRLALAGSTPEYRRQLSGVLGATSTDVEIVDWPGTTPNPEPAIVAWLGREGAASEERAPEGPSAKGPVTASIAAIEALPPLPRLDASAAADPAEFLRNVVRAALG